MDTMRALREIWLFFEIFRWRSGLSDGPGNFLLRGCATSVWILTCDVCNGFMIILRTLLCIVERIFASQPRFSVACHSRSCSANWIQKVINFTQKCTHAVERDKCVGWWIWNNDREQELHWRRRQQKGDMQCAIKSCQHEEWLQS